MRRFVSLIETRYPVADVIVFGSRARGLFDSDSDADVAILLKGAPQRLLPVKLDMADRAFDVLLETGINISPLPVWTEEWEEPDSFANPELLKNIAKEGIHL